MLFFWEEGLLFEVCLFPFDVFDVDGFLAILIDEGMDLVLQIGDGFDAKR